MENAPRKIPSPSSSSKKKAIKRRKRQMKCMYLACGGGSGVGGNAGAGNASAVFSPMNSGELCVEKTNEGTDAADCDSSGDGNEPITPSSSPRANSSSSSSCLSTSDDESSILRKKHDDAVGDKCRKNPTEEESTHRQRRSRQHKTRKERIKNSTCAVSMSCGNAHTLCCLSDGSLYCWGDNSCGQLGIGGRSSCSADQKAEGPLTDSAKPSASPVPSDSSVDVPTRVIFPENEESAPSLHSTGPLPSSPVLIRSVACGSFHTLVVSSMGHLYSFGCNTFGTLGLGDRIDRGQPSLVTAFLPCFAKSSLGENIADKGCRADIGGDNHIKSRTVIVGAAGGMSHSLVLSLDGEVYSFGRGAEGQLGDGKFGNARSSVRRCASSESSLVDLGAFEMEDDDTNESSSSFSMDSSSSDLASDDDDEKRRNKNQSEEQSLHLSLLPVKVAGMLQNNPVVMLACSQGGHGSFAVTAVDGHGWHWGLIDKLASKEIIPISSSSSQSVESPASADKITPLPTALPPPLGNGSSSCDTDSTRGTITAGTQTVHAQQSKTSVTSLNKDRIIDLSSGSRHLVCVTRAGEAWAMGAPGAHLGLGPGCQLEWIQSAGRVLLPGDVLINGVSCGERHTLLSTTSGRIFACGDASLGKLGLGNAFDPTTGGGNRQKSKLENDLDAASCPKNAIPKAVPLPDCVAMRGPKCDDADKDQVFCSTTVGEFSIACEMVLQNLRKKHEEARKNAELAAESEDQLGLSNDSFDDDVDYWGEEGLGYELEMDFGGARGPPFGRHVSLERSLSWNFSGVGELSSSLKQRLSLETRKRLSSSTRAVGGAIMSGSAKISGIVSAVKGGVQSGSGELSSSSGTSMKEGGGQWSKPKDVAVVAGSVDSHQDSFDGLAGKARRRIMMVAGCSHSCIQIVDNIN